ncbi:hypothetical protein Dda_4414 [Drechslerella dactyloides]|uniref:Uncharacterized protein n=1 Tax=Drechslerella dactyloides TaxID=74499 RepID=A0AAD6IZ32_DREDA|nr:hypothetical protein Dda_4414 [Drechslerella dactyloides]
MQDPRTATAHQTHARKRPRETSTDGNTSANGPRADDQTSSAPLSSRYRLLVCGCNLHGQLSHDPAHAIRVPDGEDAGDGLFSTVERPAVVAGGGESLRVLYVGAHSICVERDGTVYLRGLLPTLAPGTANPSGARDLPLPLPPGIHADDIVKAFGTQWSFVGVILRDGSVFTFSLPHWSLARFEFPDGNDIYKYISDIQINGLGQLCILSSDAYSVDANSVITIYPPLPSLVDGLYDSTLTSLAGTTPLSRFRLDTSTLHDAFTAVAATATGFVALIARGQVHTFGDGRYNSLGRPISSTISSATTTAESNGAGWGLVAALDGVRVQSIVAHPAGHMQLALSSDGTAYLWGGDGTENIQPTNSDTHTPDLEEEEVTMLDITDRKGDPLDFQLAAVGNDHIILTSTGSILNNTSPKSTVWAAGGADMAQTGFGTRYRCLPTALGIDEELKKVESRWQEWDVDIGGRVLQVVCGFGCTLLVIDGGG